MTNRSNLTSRSEAGLTLLEIMISIVILSFVILGVTAIVDNSEATKDRTIKLDRDNLQIETALVRMEWDFQQIYSPLYYSQKFQGNLDPNTNPGIEEVSYLYEGHPRFSGPSMDGLPIPRFQARDKSELVILTASNRRKLEDQRQSHFMWVRYYVDDVKLEADAENEERTVKGLMRQVFPDDPWAKEELPIDRTRAAVLLEGVESVEFSFWNTSTRKWDTNLQSIVDGEALIRGLQVSIKWLDSSNLERETKRWLRPLWPRVSPKDPLPTATLPPGAPGAPGVPPGTPGTPTGTEEDEP